MSAAPWLELGFLVVHLLSVAAWFGALVYRTFVVNVRSRLYFEGREREFEEYQVHLTDGARWVVLAALLVGGLSGLGLAMLRWQRVAEPAWLGLLTAKVGLYAALFAGFIYVSWRLWPRRVFAVPAEYPAEQRHAQRVAVAMLALLTAGMLLGVASAWLPGRG